jgi:2-(1,2-epoxy-1,2-dihydrophenyl)acetyl-CoA isomerase
MSENDPKVIPVTSVQLHEVGDAGPTKAIGWVKRLLHDASELSRENLLQEEAMYVELNSHTQDSGEGVASFRERRQPEWKGW